MSFGSIGCELNASPFTTSMKGSTSASDRTYIQSDGMSGNVILIALHGALGMDIACLEASITALEAFLGSDIRISQPADIRRLQTSTQLRITQHKRLRSPKATLPARSSTSTTTSAAAWSWLALWSRRVTSSDVMS